MTKPKPTARSVAHDVLDAWSGGGGFVDHLLHEALAESDLPARDRALATEIVNGVFRHRGRLDWELRSYCRGDFEEILPPVLNRLRAALYQIRFLDRIPAHAAVDEAVESSKRDYSLARYSGLVNGILRTAIRSPRELPGNDAPPLERLTVTASLPRWLAEYVVSQLGEAEAEAFALASVEVPPLFVRLNPRRTTRQQLQTDLEAQEIRSEPVEDVPESLRLLDRVVPELLDLHREGHFQVQDASSTLIGALAVPGENQLVLDGCCAPGGKLAHLASAAPESARVVGFDANPGRLDRVRENLERLGLGHVRTGAADFLSEDFPLPDRPDVILLDVPCTGSGTIRRRVDLKWRLEPADVAGAAETQRALLEAAAKRLAPGGRIVYSTCSVLTEENESVTERFLADHPDFEGLDARALLPPDSHRFVNPAGHLRTWPQRDNFDGVFAAVLQQR